MKKSISIFLILVILVMFFSGCGKTSWVKNYDLDSQVTEIDSTVIANNDSFSLSWEVENKNLLLNCKQTKKIWSLIPTDSSDETESSSLNIRVQDTFVRKEDLYYSSSATRVATEKIDNGIKITYYFDDILIAVPVCYTLRNDSLLISVNGNDIIQGGTRYQLIAAVPAPMLCRTSVNNKDSYAFTPSGIGGIIDTKVNANDAREQQGYNANIASMSVSSTTNPSESGNFNCYGIKEGNSALFCIAEDTPSAVGVNSDAGSSIKNYSTVSSTFFFTDYDYFYGGYVLDGLIKQLSSPYMGTVSIGVYPLSNEKADYNGMAECYRNYLIKSGYIKEKVINNDSPYSITYMGGVMNSSSVLGIPTKKLNVLTTFDSAKKLTEKLQKETGVAPVVRLSGFGQTGIEIGKIAGGYEFSNKLGNDKSRLEFEDYCKTNNISLYTDFNMIYYKKSGNGLSYSSDYARTAVLHAAEKSQVNIPLRDFNNSEKYRLLKRGMLGEAVQKLIKMANKKKVSGISLNDLGSISYSDYSDETYSVANKMGSDTKQFIDNISNSGHKVAASSASYFAAGICDLVFDAPTEPSGSYTYKNEIPFYQMVFHGITPLYSTSINTATNMEYKLMLAASTGSGLSFSLVDNFDPSYMEDNNKKLYAMYFDDNIDFIKSSVEKYKTIYSKVKDSKILKYDILDNNVTKTTFENGVCIYANHSSKLVSSPIGNLEGYGFVMEVNGNEKD